MQLALAVIAGLLPCVSAAKGDVWSLAALEAYASWVRDGGFACPLANRVTQVGSDDGGTASTVTCGPATAAVTGEEVAFRLTVRPDGSSMVEPWRG